LNKKERILITGGAAFIGANVAKYLLNKDKYKITIYDGYLSVGSKRNLEQAVSHSAQKDGNFRNIILPKNWAHN
jgi:nucleoside-diphosphate-sugar epimerase